MNLLKTRFYTRIPISNQNPFWTNSRLASIVILASLNFWPLKNLEIGQKIIGILILKSVRVGNTGFGFFELEEIASDAFLQH